METNTLKLYLLNYSDIKTYSTASLFILGNIVLPQLCHVIPNGGATLLPIYFFTLIGAYKYGWKVGVLTAFFSPLVNSFLFNMPPEVALQAIICKSVFLAIVAGLAAKKFQRISVPILTIVVLTYQISGTFVEWFSTGSFYFAIQDFRIGILGMLLQVFGGYLFIKYLISK